MPRYWMRLKKMCSVTLIKYFYDDDVNFCIDSIAGGMT